MKQLGVVLWNQETRNDIQMHNTVHGRMEAKRGQTLNDNSGELISRDWANVKGIIWIQGSHKGKTPNDNCDELIWRNLLKESGETKEAKELQTW